MRLELEQEAPRLLEDRAGIFSPNSLNETEEIIRKGVAFARGGNRVQARTLLKLAVELEPDSETAWMWLASTSEYPEELLVFLDHVLLINPQNQRAIEWKEATELLLAKTFVSRGIEAAKANTKESAVQFFREAMKYDERNQTASSWLESLNNCEVMSASDEKKSHQEEKTAFESTPKPYSPPHSESIVLHPLPTFAGDDDGPTQELVLPESLCSSNSFDSDSQEVSQPSEELDWGNANLDPSIPATGPKSDFTVENDSLPASVWSEAPVRVIEQDCNIQEILQTLEFDKFNEKQPDFTKDPIAARSVQWFAPAKDPVAEVSSYCDEASCPFCKCDVGDSPIICGNCDAMLTMSDMEALLAHSPSSSAVLQTAVRKLEDIWESKGLDNSSLSDLAVGYLNLGRMDDAYSCLREASSADPNNIVIANYMNTLAIRIEEIRHRQERTPELPVGKTILVVDDSPTIRKLVSSKLEKGGHEVLCAIDGVEAVEMLKTLQPDLILLDISMPRMDGYEVCKTIRSQETTRDIPVVMISGKDGFFDKVRGKMAGTTDYITKPFGPETLMKALGKYLHADVDEVGIEE